MHTPFSKASSQATSRSRERAESPILQRLKPLHQDYPDPGRRLPAKNVCARYGVTARTLDRWLRDDRLGFPKPMRINQRRYFSEVSISEWERRQLANRLGLYAYAQDGNQ